MDEKPDPGPSNSTLTPHSKVTLFVGVPITLIILGIAVWALLSGMPFATDSKKLTRTEQPAPEVVNEQTGTTATTSQISNPDEISTTTTATPAGMPAPPPQPITQVPPQPAAIPPPVATPPVARPRITPPAPAAGEVSESEAEDVVRQYVTSSDYYGTSADCIGTSSQGYKNRGYVIHVVDRCGDRGRLGRWRVDSVTREVFVQKADGRYLRP